MPARFLVLVLALLGWECRAQLAINLKTNYYAVRGGSLREIHESIKKERPWRGDAGLTGKTDWNIRWKTRMTREGDGCRLRSFRTTADITITLPTLQVRAGTPLEVLRGWNRYLASLMTHEQGHVRLATNAAVQIQKLAGQPTANLDCRALKRYHRSAGETILKASRKQHETYDRETRHGVTQGAVLTLRE